MKKAKTDKGNGSLAVDEDPTPPASQDDLDDSCDVSSVGTTETETSQASSSFSRKKTKKKRHDNTIMSYGKKRGGKSSSGPSTTFQAGKKKRFNYKYVCHVREQHGQPLFGVAFNPHLQEGGKYVFAVGGSNKVSIYDCTKDKRLVLKSTYTDPDKEENFYVVVWTFNPETMDAILIAAGGRGIIRIINPNTNKYRFLKGHGLAVNDLKIHPQDPNLLMSVSKDHSVRLWNIKSETCIAIFGGVEGHRDEVLYADFHALGKKIISCGMDHSLKIWSLESEDILKSMSESYTYDYDKSEAPFETARIHFPNFTTRDIHRNYVDCVHWFGNFVLSKSCENAIVCWKPGKIDQDLDSFLPKDQIVNDSSTTFIHQFDLKDSEIWYMRFSMDAESNTIALGNMVGKTYVWDVDSDDLDDYQHIILSHPKCTSALRQTCLSNDGSVLICVGDDSSIWRWDREILSNGSH